MVLKGVVLSEVWSFGAVVLRGSGHLPVATAAVGTHPT